MGGVLEKYETDDEIESVYSRSKHQHRVSSYGVLTQYQDSGILLGEVKELLSRKAKIEETR